MDNLIKGLRKKKQLTQIQDVKLNITFGCKITTLAILYSSTSFTSRVLREVNV